MVESEASAVAKGLFSDGCASGYEAADQVSRDGTVQDGVIMLPSARSTMDEAFEHCAERAGNVGDAITVATWNQTHGRGRAGRAWMSRPGDMLALTRAWRSSIDRAHWGWYPLIGALAVCEALSGDEGLLAASASAGAARGEACPGTPKTVAVKWPNDVLVEDSTPAGPVPGFGKIAGVLAEVRDGVLALGIGINMNDAPVAGSTSLARASGLSSCAGGDQLRAEVLTRITSALNSNIATYERYAGDPSRSGHLTRYGERCITIGMEVVIVLDDHGIGVSGSEALEGRAVGIDLSGALLVETSEGCQVITAGDVARVRPVGCER
ncbi:biotin--[acetyl-CoA-carboxylase] ligase [Devriesea agamarum]|uniref:biotin--[acetyl-CoA-carboxylase] ligase n=1 Tax=Devriesea agamarum TaxID=472569 RepID=UPI00071D9139|nr:biotin--[acetyl-CoA-carboxylase] ligase [Devriesea agamarum]